MCVILCVRGGRLLGAWQWLYSITQRYVEELQGLAGCDGWAEEQGRASVVLSQVQEALQGTGARLEDGRALLSCQGPSDGLPLCIMCDT